MKTMLAWAAGTVLLAGSVAAMAGAPLKGVDVKLGKTADAHCDAPGSIASPAPGMTEAVTAQCASPAPTPSPEAAAQAGKATKTRSNIQNN